MHKINQATTIETSFDKNPDNTTPLIAIGNIFSLSKIQAYLEER